MGCLCRSAGGACQQTARMARDSMLQPVESAQEDEGDALSEDVNS